MNKTLEVKLDFINEEEVEKLLEKNSKEVVMSFSTNEGTFGVIKQLFSQLTDEERLEIVGDYCYFCGRKTGNDYCHCQNDE